MPGDINTLYDINNLLIFLLSINKYFKHIIYVPGNHEYYKIEGMDGINMEILTTRLKSLEDKVDNLHVLINQTLQIDNYLFIGCTLWSYIKFDLPSYVNIHNFNSVKYNELNLNSKQFISKKLNYCKQQQLEPVVITHHPPSRIFLKPNKERYRYKYLYFNNLDYLFTNKMTWISGHTHYNKHLQIKESILVSNQYDHCPSYIKDFVIKI